MKPANKSKEPCTFSGDTFKNLMRAYSNERMSRDPMYRADVHAAMEKRKAEINARAAAKDATALRQAQERQQPLLRDGVTPNRQAVDAK